MLAGVVDFQSFEKQVLMIMWHVLQRGLFCFPCFVFLQEMLLFPIKAFSTGCEPHSTVA